MAHGPVKLVFFLFFFGSLALPPMPSRANDQVPDAAFYAAQKALLAAMDGVTQSDLLRTGSLSSPTM